MSRHNPGNEYLDCKAAKQDYSKKIVKTKRSVLARQGVPPPPPPLPPSTGKVTHACRT